MDHLGVRLALPADVAALTRLMEESVRGLGAADYDARQIESSLIHVYGIDRALIADGTYFVVEDGERALACGGWSRRRNLYGGDQTKGAGDDALLDPATEPARIRAFFVHPAAARRGLGTLLLEHCEAAARAAGFRRLELMATLTGEPFYARRGYRAHERTEHAMPDGERMGLVRMTRDLPA